MILILIFCFEGRAQSPVQQDILDVARGQLASFLQRIPPGQEEHFGFRKRSDFQQAVPTQVFKAFTPDSCFFSDSLLGQRNCIIDSQEWLVLVEHQGSPAVMLTVANHDQHPRVVAMGAREMARQLHALVSENHFPEKQASILRVYPLQIDFVLYGNLAAGEIAGFRQLSARYDLAEKQSVPETFEDLLPWLKEQLRHIRKDKP